MRKLLLATAMVAMASPVMASDLAKTSDGYTYFNKPGAAQAVHDADVRACKLMSARLHQPDTSPPVYAPGLAGAIGAAIGKAIVMAMQDAKARPVNVENCMVVKGWRVVALDPVAGEAASKLDAAAKSARVSPLIGAAEPEGTIVRVFANDAAGAQTSGMFSPARNTSKAALSVEAMGDPPESDKPVKATAVAGGADGTTLVFAVPAGRWKLSSLNAGLFTVSLCLGAPSFELTAGEVVYAGSFDPASASNHIGPDMTIEPYRAVFPALSGLGEKMRPAAYVNGSTGQCGGAYMYALEASDRPFADGYAFGSKAQPALVATAASAPAPAAAVAPTTATPTSAPAAAPAPTPASTAL